MPLHDRKNNKELPTKTCQNCDFEEYCNHVDSGACGRWRPDLDYRKMMDENTD